MQRNFASALAAARLVERRVSAWLMANNFRVLPLYEGFAGPQEDKAPKLIARDANGSLVVPDLLVARRASFKWVEVKWKAETTLHRLSGRWETGINQRLWNDYRAVKAETGLEVWLLFVHEKEGELRGDEIEVLGRCCRIYDGTKMGSGGMVFFPWDSLRKVARLDELPEAA